MARADQQLAVDKTVADHAAIMRAGIVDDDELAAGQARDRNRAGAMARGDDRADGHERQLTELQPTVIGVIAKLVE